MFGHKSFLRIGALSDSSISGCTKTVTNLKIATLVFRKESMVMVNHKRKFVGEQ